MIVEQQILTKLGLSLSDAKVYLYLIGKGPIAIFELSQQTQIARTSVCKTVSALKDRGLVTSLKKNNVLHVEANSPGVLLDVVRSQMELAQVLLPKLLARAQNRDDIPNLKFFSGDRGVKAAIDEMYNRLERRKLSRLYTISHPEFLEHYPKYLPNLIKRKESLRIHTSLIAPYAASKAPPVHYQTNQYRETRFMPKQFPFHCTMIINDEQTVFLSFRNSKIYAVSLESVGLSQLFKQLFLFIWQTLSISSHKENEA